MEPATLFMIVTIDTIVQLIQIIQWIPDSIWEKKPI